ncbi:MAG: hypothetical protein WAK17_20585 [Candidatus Nitrosopolaris sp.]
MPIRAANAISIPDYESGYENHNNAVAGCLKPFKDQNQSEIGIDSNLTSGHEGQFVTVLLLTLRQDAHQKQDLHNRKCICLAIFVFLLLLFELVTSSSKVL